ncbi:unnamed protein product [Thelazia callipaeda]|uniref:C3H1-type domain-containing protein n=1 Tax=Thelazia callipaeda TaxID=103827 RepID=A0A0N5D012_THECL|nr:unnamed protein product [Thelazia callipaeda]
MLAIITILLLQLYLHSHVRLFSQLQLLTVSICTFQSINYSSERRKKNAFKTSLCRSFREGLACPYGDECVFAHGEDELRLPPQVAHPKYKTQLCNKFSVWNYCPYGARCQYIHQHFSLFHFVVASSSSSLSWKQK